MANEVIADSLAPIPEWQVWCDVFKAMLEKIDITKLFVYDIDGVNASAIDDLADQFDVLGYKGMRMAFTEEAQRTLIKNAILLHKTKGTEWAIMQALQSIGFTDIKLKKGLADGYDHWAKFGIEITNPNLQLTQQNMDDIIAIIMEYKRAVCVLMDISMTVQVQDTLDISDEDKAWVIPIVTATDTLSLTGDLKYDGQAIHDGEHAYNGESDVVTIG